MANHYKVFRPEYNHSKKNIVSLQLSGYPDASNTQRNQ